MRSFKTVIKKTIFKKVILIVSNHLGRTPRGVMANVLDYDIAVCEFELQTLWYIHVRSNPFGEDMNPDIHKLWVKYYNFCHFIKDCIGIKES